MTIIIIEGFQFIREALVLAFERLFPGAAVQGASTGAEGVRFCQAIEPDVVLLNLALPDGNGFDFVEKLKGVAPSSRIVAVAACAREYTVSRVLRANIHGFIDQAEQPLSVLEEAVWKVMAGGRYFSPSVVRLHNLTKRDPGYFAKVLSDHEQELLALFGEGLTNQEIAWRTQLACGTVRNHRCNIMNKLGIHSTLELIRFAMRKGFAQPPGPWPPGLVVAHEPERYLPAYRVSAAGK